MFSYDCMRILLMMLDCAVVHSTATWVSNSLKGHPLVCNLGLQSFKGTYLATVLQSWFIGVRFFKAEICPGSHSLRGYQWSLKDSGVRVGARIARGILLHVSDSCLQSLLHCWFRAVEHNPVQGMAEERWYKPTSTQYVIVKCFYYCYILLL